MAPISSTCSSATFSRLRSAAALLLLALGTSSATAHASGGEAPGSGKVLLTQEEALALAFPDCSIERRTIYLDDRQRKRVAELAKGEFEPRIVRTYVATREGELVGTA